MNNDNDDNETATKWDRVKIVGAEWLNKMVNEKVFVGENVRLVGHKNNQKYQLQ